MAIALLNKKNEIEYLKINTIVNAIITVGNLISSTVARSEFSGSDALNKSLNALGEELLPHNAEERKRKAKMAKIILEQEVKKGPLKIQVMQSKRKKGKK